MKERSDKELLERLLKMERMMKQAGFRSRLFPGEAGSIVILSRSFRSCCPRVVVVAVHG